MIRRAIIAVAMLAAGLFAAPVAHAGGLILGPYSIWRYLEKGSSPDILYTDSVLIWEFLSNANPTPDTSYVGTNSGALGATTAAPVWTAATGGVSACYSFDGADYIWKSSGLGDLATLTSGAVVVWVRANSTATDLDRYWSLHVNGSANSTAIIFDSDYNSKNIDAQCVKDGTLQWLWKGTNQQIPAIAGWVQLVVNHNGTEPAFYRNMKTIPGTFTTSTDKTKWLKCILTDATVKSDHFSVGATLYNGAVYHGMTGWEKKPEVYKRVMTAAEIATNFWLSATNHGWTQWDFLNRTGLALEQAVAYSFNYPAAADLATNGNHGSLNGPTWLAPGGGGDGKGYYAFDGSNDRITTPNAASMRLGTNDFTLSCWILGDSAHAAQSQLVQMWDSKPKGWMFRPMSSNSANAKPDLLLYDATEGSIIKGPKDITTAIWTHIVWTRAGSVVRMYQDGLVQNTTTSGTVKVYDVACSNTQQMVIGMDRSLTTTQYKGYLDTLRVINGTAFTPAQVATNFWIENREMGWTQWDFDNRTGLYLSQALACSFNYAAADQSTNGNHGTVSGATWASDATSGYYSFDGLNDSIVTREHASMTGDSSFTISAWWKSFSTLTDQNNYTGITATHDASYRRSHYLAVANAENFLFGYDTSAGTEMSIRTPALTGFSNTWRHVVGVFNDTANTLTVYVDGVSVTNKTGVTGARQSTGMATMIGARDESKTPTYFYKGGIDGVRLFSTALTSNQVLNLYQAKR